MWQIDFFFAIERERERQLQLERHRRLADAVRASRPRSRGWLRRASDGAVAIARETADVIGSSLDRLAIGPHHT